ncbi:MAG TPA: VOC family protein [Chthoniobacterales bacterium]|jgi:predicted 3-demethylubiquinone-9 3-methyltransferase (glyoxalase superfamily)|nr:VOC family protein [Chthoniobacterales bacterium]
MPFLWFDTQAEEAANFYVSIFENSKVNIVTRYGESGPGKNGSVMTVGFTLDGQEFTALNAGPQFPFTEAVSFVVNCESQEEIDYFWEKLSTGGKEVQCGWLKDKFGLPWQIVPLEFFELISKGTQEQLDRVMAAMMEMVKMDLAKLKQAYEK